MRKDRQLPFNLYMIGFMGSGKSSTAEYMHREYGMPRIEMDDAIVKKAGKSIRRIFEEDGEPVFRQMETDLLKEIAQAENTVISCGGGVPVREENVRLMKESGRIVLLSADPETILERVGRTSNRPLLEGRKSVEGIRELMELRSAAYEAAADLTITVDHRSIREICEEILDKVCE